jgi:hypothetical protein
MVTLFRHRHPKGADPAKRHLSSPRHIPISTDIARQITGRSSFERSNYVQNSPVPLLASTGAGAQISADICA